MGTSSPTLCLTVSQEYLEHENPLLYPYLIKFNFYFFCKKKKKNPVVFSWVLKTASVTRVEFGDLRFFSNGWGGIRLFVWLKLAVFSGVCGIYFQQCRKEQACWKMLNRFVYEPGQKAIFRFLNRKNPRQSFVLKYEIIPSLQSSAAFIYCSLVFHSESCLQQSKACLASL